MRGREDQPEEKESNLLVSDPACFVPAEILPSPRWSFFQCPPTLRLAAMSCPLLMVQLAGPGSEVSSLFSLLAPQTIGPLRCKGRG